MSDISAQLGIEKSCEFKVPGGTPLYEPCKYVPRQKVGVLGLFGLKTGIHFAHFGLKSGVVFEGTRGGYERIYFFSSK